MRERRRVASDDCAVNLPLVAQLRVCVFGVVSDSAEFVCRPRLVGDINTQEFWGVSDNATAVTVVLTLELRVELCERLVDLLS